eukprot:TRINITY_DN33581_c0_g1_i1.p1 TRINITY_DN33581_c0_g1~~TRINITY_DN33581_c0_g1_i1.p1  ORF type:complete len:226 (+),score=16.71 TRINITY_DN33581_c0_g1_i1:102-680(+)
MVAAPSPDSSHLGYVSAVHCHPGTLSVTGGSVDITNPARTSGETTDLLLTASWDWTCKLWSTQLLYRPLWTFKASDSCLDAQWHPSNPSLFAVSTSDARISFTHVGSPSDSIVATARTSIGPSGDHTSGHVCGNIRWTRDGRHLVCGDLSGGVSVFDVGEGIRSSTLDGEGNFGKIVEEFRRRGPLAEGAIF